MGNLNQDGRTGNRTQVLPNASGKIYHCITSLGRAKRVGVRWDCLRGRGGVAVRLLTSHRGESDSIPGGAAPGFSHVVIVLVGGFSRGSPVPPPLHSGAAPYLASPSSALKTSLVLREGFVLGIKYSNKNIPNSVAAAALNEKKGGDPSEKPPISGIVRHDSHMRKSGLNRQGIEPGSPCWEVSSLTIQPPWPPSREVGQGVVGVSQLTDGQVPYHRPTPCLAACNTPSSHGERLLTNCRQCGPKAINHRRRAGVWPLQGNLPDYRPGPSSPPPTSSLPRP
ncbi:hypothetical protein PR048_000918 [Dryococelus australis]|uniref:Uncharacterized protein n=1 Tax=Dryococelus australis TaxID=614101 RepID=A0ABQ9IGI8_9NEOP|nr:hypothetical protein PR048_000918 [Dryococelus australis]